MLSVYFILLNLIAAYGAFTDQENLGKNQPPYRAKQHNPQVDQPPFCFGLECPSYRLVQNYSSFEHREYEETKWISIKMPMNNKSIVANYNNLFEYIKGSNTAGTKLPRSIPIRLLISLKKAAKTATLSLFLSAKVKNPPMPTNANHFINIFPKTSMYVKSFPWSSKKMEYATKATTLMEELTELGLYFDGSFYGWSMYPSTSRKIKGHSEVWFLAGNHQQSADFTRFLFGL